MIQEVKYKRAVKAYAMSKSVSQSGLHINDGLANNTVSLHSINTKDGKVTSHLMLQIPKENLQEVIDALKLFV